MNQNLLNFNNFKFRASSIGELMTGFKIDREAELLALNAKIDGTKNKETATYQALLDKRDKLMSDELPQTVKSKLIKIYVTELTGRRENVVSKYMEKGKSVEDTAIDTLSGYLDDFIVKNDERKENEYVSGECDIERDDEIIDAKSCWDLFTFETKKNESLNEKYEWQLRVYMWLWEKTKARIAYILEDSPDSIIADECKRLLYQIGSDKKDTEIYRMACEQIEFGMKYKDIPVKYRVFLTDYVLHEDKYIDALKSRLEVCRSFLNAYAEKEYNRVNGIEQLTSKNFSISEDTAKELVKVAGEIQKERQEKKEFAEKLSDVISGVVNDTKIILPSVERIVDISVGDFAEKISEQALKQAEDLVWSGETTKDNNVIIDQAIVDAVKETIPQEHQAEALEDIKTEIQEEVKTEINEDGNTQIVIPFPDDRKSEILSIISKTNKIEDLNRLYVECKKLMEEYPKLKEQFTKRKLELKAQEEAPKPEVKKPIKKVVAQKEEVTKDDAYFLSLLDECETSKSVKDTFQANKTDIQKRPDILQAYIAKGQMLVNKEKEEL